MYDFEEKINNYHMKMVTCDVCKKSIGIVYTTIVSVQKWGRWRNYTVCQNCLPEKEVE